MRGRATATHRWVYTKCVGLRVKQHLFIECVHAPMERLATGSSPSSQPIAIALCAGRHRLFPLLAAPHAAAQRRLPAQHVRRPEVQVLRVCVRNGGTGAVLRSPRARGYVHVPSIGACPCAEPSHVVCFLSNRYRTDCQVPVFTIAKKVGLGRGRCEPPMRLRQSVA